MTDIRKPDSRLVCYDRCWSWILQLWGCRILSGRIYIRIFCHRYPIGWRLNLRFVRIPHTKKAGQISDPSFFSLSIFIIIYFLLWERERERERGREREREREGQRVTETEKDSERQADSERQSERKINSWKIKFWKSNFEKANFEKSNFENKTFQNQTLEN